MAPLIILKFYFSTEVKFVSAYRSVRQKERVTLRSPRTPRRSLSSSSGKVNEAGLRYTLRSSPAGSPVMQRKQKPPVPAKPSLKTNGINGGQNGIPEELLEKYRIGNVIGEGNFAVVKECTEKYNKREYALKIISKNKVKAKKQMIDSEVSILRIVKHPNIIQLLEEYSTDRELYLVMELVRGGDLFDAISSATKYTERDASGMMYNLASALKYLHSLNVVHRDIKLENLLVFEHEDGSKSLKLGDFGLATFVKGKQYTVCGTPTYVAPEILAETGYGLKVDMWSSGVITYILLCGFPPFVSQSNDQDELFDKIMEGTFDFPSPYWDDISESAQDLIEGLLQVDPGTRMSATQMLEHPWVADDTALDNDMHTSVARKLSMHFEKRQSKFPELSPGVKLVAMTALDKGSRFFEGRGHSPVRQLQPVVKQNGYDDYDDDEIF
ncbi:serine/threonine-protein kinase DCLK1-like [Lingula anatina]|uniref:non-specific serine/threonine protein kinase n=1 Tax=Lingula anatina TaxID=7574 RepID=A0A1S3JI36_LINAN|nr:serine/threonine-protein kinase DCLK1-like [Lingula anatina]|eukprot:XP_013410075.1 serine/threonine-protein kinase DCLK1-like [Lingula anatina]